MARRRRPALGSLLAWALLAACGPVRSTALREDWAERDAQALKRLVVVVQPLPDGNQKAGELLARFAHRYVHQHTDFLVKGRAVQGRPVDVGAICAATPGAEGLLHLALRLERRAAGFETLLEARLRRCSDGREAWRLEAGGPVASRDEGLGEQTAAWVRELGGEIGLYVAPVVRVVGPSLDRLPQPALHEDDRGEKNDLELP